MALSNTQKEEIVKKYQRDSKDTGSSEVQVALLTANITSLTGHMQTHKHDYHSRRGLLGMVNKRRKLLSYLKKTEAQRYRDLIASLGLRK
jgi:small subunit ribosomal protein S15